MQKSVGFDGQAMTANITMSAEDLQPVRDVPEKPADITCNMDVLTAIKTRQSIRKFSSKPVSQDMVNTVLCAGTVSYTHLKRKSVRSPFPRTGRLP